jgi:hypothetical protein
VLIDVAIFCSLWVAVASGVVLTIECVCIKSSAIKIYLFAVYPLVNGNFIGVYDAHWVKLVIAS